VSAGEIAGLVAAGALALLVLLLAVPILKVGRTLDETTLAIRKAHEGAAPILDNAVTTVRAVNNNLERIDGITANAASMSSNAAALTSVVAATLGGPLVKAAAFSYGVRQAVKGRREGRREVERSSSHGRRRRGGKH